jgi:hypothetical protein
LRLVLPAAPFLVLMCGAFLEWLGRFRFAWPAFVLAASTAVPTALQFPNTISYLNVWSGGLTNAWRYLGDSNLDWGQGLPELAEYAARHNVGVLNISYFGNDRPHRMFPPGSYRVLPPPWNTAGLNTFRLIPERGYYAISAALLPGHYFAPRFRDYYAEFREHQPVAILGGSILLYRFE